MADQSLVVRSTVPAGNATLRGFQHAGDARTELGLAAPVEQAKKSEYDSFYDPF